MKTTIELPDDLFHTAKAVALRRRTTLKALFIDALRREVSGSPAVDEQVFQVDEEGLPYLPARGVTIDRARIEEIADEAER